MGHKVHPKSLRLGYIYTWNSKWFAKGKKYISNLESDILIVKYIRKTLKEADIVDVHIERNDLTLTITILTAKPGFIIGRSGKGVIALKDTIKKKFTDPNVNVTINIQEVQDPLLSAAVVVQYITRDIEQRLSHRRVMKEAVRKVLQAGAKGVKILLAGRLDGAEIARSAVLTSGKMPLQTLRADVDYSRDTAHMTYGTIGVKVWIYKGDIIPTK